MSLKITFLGHSGFLFEGGGARVVVDPFLTGNPAAKHKPSDLKCQYVAITHGHADHVGDAADIAKANDATLIANYEICDHLARKGVKKTDPGNIGGAIQTSFGSIAFTPAFHSSSYEGTYMGMPGGLVLKFPEATVYHLGDTSLFSDLKLMGELYKPDIAIIPVGDRFTMNPTHGATAAQWIRPKVAIPCHYATFPMLTSDISAFQPQGVETRVIKPGECWEYA
ncbi:MAG: metal-dependent hydrolase [Phycisphaerales bacterium]|nr:metal-dependent hydrolase [Phycisphaerales bacterium]